MDNITGDYHDDDSCSLGFSILGIIATSYAILQLILTYIKKISLCIPENTWYLHFLFLICILNLFIISAITHSSISVTENILLLIQLPPAICICCMLTFALNLFLICAYKHYFSYTFLLVLPILLAFPVSILFIVYQFSSYSKLDCASVIQSCTPINTYFQLDCTSYIQNNTLSNAYLYLNYFLTISMILTLCLYSTLYGKLLCVTTLLCWVLWNIQWSVFGPFLDPFFMPYMYPTLGHILLIFYIYPIILSKYFQILSLMLNQMRHRESSAAPPPLSSRSC
nr:G protein-coupled receptor 11 [Elephant endotheliotropic herpesvirus 1A]